MQMKLSRNRYVVFGVFVIYEAMLGLLSRSSLAKEANVVVVVIFCVVVLIMSMIALTRWFRHGPEAGLGQAAAMPERIRRWALDEPDRDGGNAKKRTIT